MSLTILQQPNNGTGFFTGSTILQSANNDSYFTLSGTTQTMDDVSEYKFVADVYVDTVLEATLKAFPDPTTGFGVFNLRNVASNFVSYDFPVVGDTSVFQKAPNSWANIQLFFREEYLSGSTFTAPTATTSSSLITYTNAALEYVTAVGIDWFTYQMDSTFLGKFLQTKQDMAVFPFPNIQTPFNAYVDLRQWLYYWNSNDTVLGVYIITYDAWMNQLDTYFVTNPYQNDSNELQIVGTGIMELADTVDFNDVAYYDIALVNGAPPGSHIISQQVRYKVQQSCGRFADGAYKLYWLDQFGEFNSWYFTKKNITTINLTQSTYKKIQGKVQTNGQFVQNTYDPASVPFYTAVQDQVMLTTDFLSDSDVIFLKGIFRSPVVFMEDTNGLIQSVVVSQNSYVLNKTVNQRPYALQLTVQTSVTDFAQQL